MDSAELYEPTTDYGSGVARRRIRLTGTPGKVVGELEDQAHGMRCLIEHDGRVITGVTSDFRRFPMTTCIGAGEPLEQIVGEPVGSDFRTFFRDGRARMNCTHMFDIAWLATAHAARGETVRTYDVEVPDEVDGRTEVRLFRDGERLLRWTLYKSIVQAPEEMAGRHLFGGFTSWALEKLAGDDLEAALVLQKGYFVAQARRWVVEPGLLRPREKAAHAGVCHGYGHARIDQAARLPESRRDFTDHPERLLKFL